MASRPKHPALDGSHALSSDIYPRLFDWFFSSNEFTHWLGGRQKWRRLHCSGGPGCGKTSFSALLAARLRDRFHPVATLFISADVQHNDAAFVEEFLVVTCRQLNSTGEDDDLDAAIERGHGQRATVRINLIREVLYKRLSSHRRAFLVLDGVDRCGEALEMLLDAELASLQQRGVSVLVTSRLPVYEKPEEVTCDVHASERLTLFWECGVCHEFVICYPCKENTNRCEVCSSDAFVEPYDQVNCDIGHIPTDAMREFVAWDMEREHGDLDLGSVNDKKPPLSTLGSSLHEDRAIGAATRLVQHIVDKAYGNVVMAKLRLDLAHRSQTLESIEAVHDRLPNNVLEIFRAGINSIEQQPDAWLQDLGILAIAAATRTFNGVPFESLKQWLQKGSTQSSLVHVASRSPETFLRAARGFLVQKHTDPIELTVYHPDFYYYVAEDYNEGLFWKRSQLQVDGIVRAFTLGPAVNTMKKQENRLHRSVGMGGFSQTQNGNSNMPSNFALSRTTTSFTSRS